MNTLLQQLINLRKAKKVSQLQLAKSSGLSRMTIVRTEQEQIDPRLSTVQVMVRALGLELVLIPQELKIPLQEFIQSGGRYLGQPQGVEAPLSVVDALRLKKSSK